SYSASPAHHLPPSPTRRSSDLSAAPAASVNEVRASLARFLFRGPRAERLAGMLSGGERFRAVLAALLLAQPAPQLLLLDEPTNKDRKSTRLNSSHVAISYAVFC